MTWGEKAAEAAFSVRTILHGMANARWHLLLLFVASLGVLTPHAARADQDACLAAHEQAQLLRMRARYLNAREQLIACAQASCPSAVRADCKGWLEEVESSLPTLVFAVSDEQGHDLVEARVSNQDGVLTERADGRAISVDPGVHTLRIEAAGFAAGEQQLSVREGEKRRLVRVTLRALTPAAEAARGADLGQPALGPHQLRARRLLLSSYVLAGLGVVALGVGIPLGVIGHNDLDALRKECRPDCSRGEVRDGKRKYVLADVAFAAAGAFLGAAVVTFVLGFRKQRAADRTPAVGLWLDPQGATLSWQRAF